MERKGCWILELPSLSPARSGLRPALPRANRACASRGWCHRISRAKALAAVAFRGSPRPEAAAAICRSWPAVASVANRAVQWLSWLATFSSVFTA